MSGDQSNLNLAYLANNTHKIWGLANLPTKELTSKDSFFGSIFEATLFFRTSTAKPLVATNLLTMSFANAGKDSGGLVYDTSCRPTAYHVVYKIAIDKPFSLGFA